MFYYLFGNKYLYSVAFKNTKVFQSYKQILEELGYIIIGDAAYPQLKMTCVPISGSHKSDPHLDQYNFFLSQIRIRIEMVNDLILLQAWNI